MRDLQKEVEYWKDMAISNKANFIHENIDIVKLTFQVKEMGDHIHTLENWLLDRQKTIDELNATIEKMHKTINYLEDEISQFGYGLK